MTIGFTDISLTATGPEATRKPALATQRRLLAKQFTTRLNALISRQALSPREAERLTAFSFAIYRKTRDVIGPAYAVLCHELLCRMKNDNFELCLCLGRDAIPMAILLKILLRLAPMDYAGIGTHQIKYLHVCRNFMINRMAEREFRSKFAGYLDRRGLAGAQRLLLTDLVCFGGSLHSGFKAFFPDKTIEGLYFYSPKNKPATKGPDVRSFINDVLGTRPHGVHFDFVNMLLLFEALFSGPFETAHDFRLRPDRVHVEQYRKSPGDVALTRGLTGGGIVLLNQVALLGLRDAAIMMHRRRMSGEFDDRLAIVERFYRFVSSAPSPVWTDIWLSVPWGDHGVYTLAEQNPIELNFGGIWAGKLSDRKQLFSLDDEQQHRPRKG